MSTWPEVLAALVARTDLTAEQTTWAMGEILAGEATPSQIAGFAVALRTKGETVDEVQGFVDTMYEHANTISVPGRVLDVVGTGGDRSMSVNISTMSAIVAAGAGATVVKHGNRSASSKTGTADVLERLGVRLDLSAADVVRLASEVGITFCFAPIFHPAMRFAGPVRGQLGVPTTFNFLGPLANPVGVRRQSIGVSDPAMAERVVGALAELGAERALVYFGDDGLDELTTTTTSTAFELLDGSVRRFEIDPVSLGIPRSELGALAGGDAAGNAQVVRRVLGGQPGAVRDIALLNAAAALFVAGLADDLGGGLELAGKAVDEGRAEAVLDGFVRTSVAAREAEGA
jgi:anthranilate phosphoribosyltransferase